VVKYLALPRLASVELMSGIGYASDMVTAFKRLKSITKRYCFSPFGFGFLGTTQRGEL